MAITLLGELKYMGCTNIIITFIESLRDKLKRKRPTDFDAFYLATVEALSKIGTKKALNWLADELFRPGQNPFNWFLLYLAIAGTPNSEKFVGFKIIGRKKIFKGKQPGIETIFQLRGKRYRLPLYPQKVNV